jgi:hypothetical protein
MSFKFDPGVILATKQARDIVFAAKTAGQAYSVRHLKGDFGDVDYKTRQQNKANITNKTGLVVSQYILSNGTKLQIITDFDNQATAFCGPDEDCSFLLKNKKLEE